MIMKKQSTIFLSNSLDECIKEWNNTFIIDFTSIIKIKNFTFGMVPYVPPGRFVEALNIIA